MSLRVLNLRKILALYQQGCETTVYRQAPLHSSVQDAHSRTIRHC